MLNYKKLGNPLMTPEELIIMYGSKYKLQLQRAHLFYSRKYTITKHTIYPLLTDADEKISLKQRIT